MHKKLEVWSQERNQTASKVIWHFSTDDTRVKLQHLYPVFETTEENNIKSGSIGIIRAC
ncbi:hypothetical protein [Okeania hirsuta]|uniref:hypothetical protein n=1 Tax=Okeania TaxID=1458928 RepID=UPI0013751566|nr:hypothetical protein [Okeania sp. SIO1H4]NES88996.1 hypothetical protein [Okeania sp. SIO2B9]NET13720.1 hypothetical protein [Okeania sp. SIO1H6]NET23481.1 hypothetical protein [Okeania sp. SIO1H5]NET80195.1 hypothetical protein [Okeania sp. SIO1F9]NET97239.1 hypothetical protein [Okeania sp. SIO1H2]